MDAFHQYSAGILTTTGMSRNAFHNRGWILVFVALIAGCVTYNPPETVSHSFCGISHQDVQQICLAAAKDKQLVPYQKKPDEKPDEARFRFNYSVTMPNGEVAAEVFCDIDAAQNAVVGAQLLDGSATSGAADYLHDQGLCSEWKLESNR